ncbi:hypothetical protein J437_LFUL008271 [Ladona fulva]|uniref:Mutator-like transposase domain-containing protein n=1 Tax=Ladona fulva TaxID=123851 RepID=A0A8K0P3Q6_LADFU|nr:hypothetical protein J437_LFUL008271 [Ladona fulva]
MPKVVKFRGNRYTKEQEQEYASTSAKKLKGTSDFNVSVAPNSAYSIFNFNLVFTMLSTILKCKTCDSDVIFLKRGEQGLGFQLCVRCSCGEKLINSSPKINNKAFEINRRIVFVMRLMGVGLHALNLFCSLMDLSKGFTQKTFYSAVDNIHSAVKGDYDLVIRKAGREEIEKTREAENGEENLTVCGDGSWSKRGFSSMYGVITLIGQKTSKVLDNAVKSTFCHVCISMKSKAGTAEFDQWYSEHKEQCFINHDGSAGKMEVDGMLEIFARSIELHNTKYKRYIGDGDTKTFTSLLKVDKDLEKKECINHVHKRMGSRLRNAKKIHKNLGGHGYGKLTNELIKELTIYYGLAIRRHSDSAAEMKREILETVYHSTTNMSSNQIATATKPKKKKRCPEEWSKNKIKKSRNSGKEYTSPKTGKTTPAKTPPSETVNTISQRLSELEEPMPTQEPQAEPHEPVACTSLATRTHTWADLALDTAFDQLPSDEECL